MTNEDLKIRRQELCGEFWIALHEALESIGGDPSIIDIYMDAPLCEFVELVAPNGIRPVFDKTGHVHYFKPQKPDEELPPDNERLK